MKRIIFTIYDDLKTSDHTNVDLDISAQTLVSEYMDRLVDNKKLYADSHGIDFKFYHNTLGSTNLSNTDVAFTNSNLYKHKLMADLAEEYDQVMYVDMDVVFNTSENVFESIDLSKGIAIKDQDDCIQEKIAKKALYLSFGMRNPTLKYHITKELLGGKDNHVMNTGIMIGNSSDIKKIQFVKRLPPIVKKIKKIKDSFIENDKMTWIKHFFYPNNESIFSYILEKHNIPYQLLDDEWHDIRDDKVIDRPYGKVIHFINKQFHAFFNDKSKVIYSLYIRIEDENLDDAGTYVGDTASKGKRTQEKMDKYYDQLIENKEQYAKSIGATFVMFERDEMYENFLKKYPQMSEYDAVNIYKIFILEYLAESYDLVLYLDFDVFCRKPADIFNIIDCSTFLRCQNSSALELGIKNTLEYYAQYDKDFRNPESKYWNSHALLAEHDLDSGATCVFNTGIIAASSSCIKQLDFFSNLDEILEDMTELKENSIYPENIQKAFGYDNETIFAFKIVANNVRHKNLDEKVWHFKHYSGKASSSRLSDKEKHSIRKENYKSAMAITNPVLVHFISKQLELAFDE